MISATDGAGEVFPSAALKLTAEYGKDITTATGSANVVNMVAAALLDSFILPPPPPAKKVTVRTGKAAAAPAAKAKAKTGTKAGRTT